MKRVMHKWVRSLGHHLVPNVGTVLAVALLLFVYNAWAAPQAAPLTQSAGTDELSYQGQLLDNGGTPVNEQVEMTFRIYNVPTGGTALWTEAHTGGNSVPVDNGRFHVLLGSLTPIPSSVWENDDLYLEVQVGSEVLSPRELWEKPTPTEQKPKLDEHFEAGDLLCWNTDTGQSELCTQAASPFVMRVVEERVLFSVGNHRTANVKVLGPVRVGEPLVSSDVPGYAVAWSQIGEGEPPEEVVIAKALENFDGDRGMVKAQMYERDSEQLRQAMINWVNERINEMEGENNE